MTCMASHEAGSPPVRPRPHRRHVLLGLGAVGAAPLLLARPSAAGADGGELAECLADLIESGAVTRGDLVAR
ncbi:hypothetical protein [Nocardioides dongxiaopingii]|uniref:hypothetical protein n=1 Tax=Nocardioides dongxiaopingii TaxID=2576036 RepID=UPI0010C76473|nr:hypothetical protein [Nocardioides dongxiaopingii]